MKLVSSIENKEGKIEEIAGCAFHMEKPLELTKAALAAFFSHKPSVIEVLRAG